MLFCYNCIFIVYSTLLVSCLSLTANSKRRYLIKLNPNNPISNSNLGANVDQTIKWSLKTKLEIMRKRRASSWKRRILRDQLSCRDLNRFSSFWKRRGRSTSKIAISLKIRYPPVLKTSMTAFQTMENSPTPIKALSKCRVEMMWKEWVDPM